MTSTALANIDWLLAEHGSISLSDLSPVGCIAAAADKDLCYAMLRRRKGEAVIGLLHRLDQAIAEAAESATTIDEVNPPSGFPSRRP